MTLALPRRAAETVAVQGWSAETVATQLLRFISDRVENADEALSDYLIQQASDDEERAKVAVRVAYVLRQHTTHSAMVQVADPDDHEQVRAAVDDFTSPDHADCQTSSLLYEVEVLTVEDAPSVSDASQPQEA